MIEEIIQFKIVKGERRYILNISKDSPLGELYDVLSEMRGEVYNRLKQIEEAEKQQAEKKAESIEEKQDG